VMNVRNDSSTVLGDSGVMLILFEGDNNYLTYSNIDEYNDSNYILVI
jgi:hypothetical protein